MHNRVSSDELKKIAAVYRAGEGPAYVYFKERIRKKCALFNSIPVKNKSIHFATMANINPDFLDLIRGERINVFVNSLPHLKAALDCGFKGREIIFTSSALDENAMKAIAENNITVNLDSTGQVAKWSRLFPSRPFGVRCNIGDKVKPHESAAGSFIGRNSRLGIMPEELPQFYSNPLVEGLHLYAGTDIMDVGYLIKCYSELLKAAENFPNIKYIDFGGGFAIEDREEYRTFDIERYGLELERLTGAFSKKTGRDIEIVLEPGRIIGGDAAFFACEVTDVKYRNELQLAGVNASSVQFPRPLFYPDTAVHPVIACTGGGEPVPGKIKTSIFGASTYSRDFLSKNIFMPAMKEGDLVIFANAGSYCAAAYTQFLGFEKPREIFV